MSWHWRNDDTGFHYGWTSERFWLSVASHRGTVWFDVWAWRFRWAGPEFRPLFSERNGYQKWHHVGRLALNTNRRRRESA